MFGTVAALGEFFKETRAAVSVQNLQCTERAVNRRGLAINLGCKQRPRAGGFAETGGACDGVGTE